MNTPLHPARRLSRRTFVGTALMGAAVSGGVGLPTSMLAAQGTPAPAGALGQTPLGEQLAWLLATLNDGASALSAEDVSAKFAPGFLTAVPPDLVIAVIQQAA